MNRRAALKIREHLCQRQGESGQTLVFAPVVLLMIAIFFGITYQVAIYAKQRVALQEQADSAAIGAARVQGMMLESIATGNDAIAVNVGGIGVDFAKMSDPINIPKAIEDIIQRIEWIRGIQGIQSEFATDTGTIIAAGAAEVSGIDAGADLIFPLPPGSSSIMGVSIPTTPSGLYLNVARSWYTAELFMIRKPEIPDLPSDFPIKEKPIVIAFANLYHDQDHMMTASSAGAVYFIPWGDPEDRDTMDIGTAYICMMIPGPFWGARLDEVGNLSIGKVIGGEAAYYGWRLVNKYTLQMLNNQLKDQLISRVGNAMLDATKIDGLDTDSLDDDDSD
jgi:hypothetical protein